MLVFVWIVQKKKKISPIEMHVANLTEFCRLVISRRQIKIKILETSWCS